MFSLPRLKLWPFEPFWYRCSPGCRNTMGFTQGFHMIYYWICFGTKLYLIKTGNIYCMFHLHVIYIPNINEIYLALLISSFCAPINPIVHDHNLGVNVYRIVLFPVCVLGETSYLWVFTEHVFTIHVLINFFYSVIYGTSTKQVCHTVVRIKEKYNTW